MWGLLFVPRGLKEGEKEDSKRAKKGLYFRIALGLHTACPLVALDNLLWKRLCFSGIHIFVKINKNFFDESKMPQKIKKTRDGLSCQHK